MSSNITNSVYLQESSVGGPEIVTAAADAACRRSNTWLPAELGPGDRLYLLACKRNRHTHSSQVRQSIAARQRVSGRHPAVRRLQRVARIARPCRRRLLGRVGCLADQKHFAPWALSSLRRSPLRIEASTWFALRLTMQPIGE